MRVKKDSWHYNLVSHKWFINKPRKDNQDSSSYISAVFLAIFVDYLAILLLLIPVVLFFYAVATGADIKIILEEHVTLVMTYCVLVASPVWSVILISFFGLFARKSWRELRVMKN